MGHSHRTRAWRLIAILGLFALLAVAATKFVTDPPPESDDLGAVPADRHPLHDLMTALAAEPYRPVEGRLVGFAHAPLPPATGASDVPPTGADVTLAVAGIQEAAAGRETAEMAAALGVAHLVLGRHASAIAVLEEAVQLSNNNPTFLNDLAVAYLARSRDKGPPEDLARALAAANRAIALDGQLLEARFNRALALGALHLSAEEADAWADYQGLDKAGPWTREAANWGRRVDERRRRLIVGADPTDHQFLREQIEDRLLPAWGAAYASGDYAAAQRSLDEAARQAARLAASGGDRMAYEEIATIRDQLRARASFLGDRALGFQLYGAARNAWTRNDISAASTLMDAAAIRLRAAESPYWQWAPILRAIVLRNQAKGDASLRELSVLSMERIPPLYFNLRGRLAWTSALSWARLGRYDKDRDFITQAQNEFRAAREHGYVVSTQTILAEAEWFLGSRAKAWRELFAALELAGSRPPTGRVEHLDLAAGILLDMGLPDAALEFQNAFIRVANNAGFRAEGLLRRARTRVRLEDPAGAARDLNDASLELRAFSDGVVRERLEADIDITSAELAVRQQDCLEGLRRSNAALRYTTDRNSPMRKAFVLTLRATCYRREDKMEAARADLVAAVELFERQRATIASPADRALAFETERGAYRDLLSLVVKASGIEAGLAVAERTRQGVLAEAWRRVGAPAARQRDLPPGTAIVYYGCLADRVLVWILTRDDHTSFSWEIPEADLRRTVTRMHREIERGGTLKSLRPISKTLFEALVARALELADGAKPVQRKSTIVFVPDGALVAVPFGALPDERDVALLETRIVLTAPSMQTYLAASERLATFTPTRVLAVGDGHDPTVDRLRRLPDADGEARRVASLYKSNLVLPGGLATKRRVLGGVGDVIHFSTHAVVDEGYPMLSRILLAPERGRADSGWLLAAEITANPFSRAGVVVLASCEGAAGTFVEGEGALSLARAFFAAQVPAVVASLWPVNDDLAILMTTLHRSLIAGRDPARALQAGQRAVLDQLGRDLPVKRWGGFVVMGGSTPISYDGS